MNNNSTETEVMPDSMQVGSNRGNYSGLAIDDEGSKQARTSGDTVSNIKEDDSIECLAITSGVSKNEQHLGTSEVVSCIFHLF